MKNNKINFTKKLIDELPIPENGKRLYFYDTKVRALEIMITSNGKKSFKVYRKVDNKPIRVTIGRYPDISIEEARKQAMEYNTLLETGTNPNEQKLSLRQEVTFNELFQQYMDKYSKVHKKSWVYDEREVNKFLNHWFNRRISTITKAEVKSLHDKICAENGLYQANRILERIRAMFNKAIEWGWQGINPSIGIKKFKEKSRDRFLQSDEISSLLKTLAEEENTLVRNYIYISLFTGARKSNVLSMKWEDIMWDRKEWHIKDSKNGENLVIPLLEEAIDILMQCKQNNKSEYVFPSEKSKLGYLQDPKKTWQKILKIANIRDVRIHDLRRTLGSYQAITGSSLLVIGKSLGHKSTKATEVYSKLQVDPVRKSMENAVKTMFKDIRKDYK
jgi:integrase